jgi:ABC-type sugar transport system substrate-binding protein
MTYELWDRRQRNQLGEFASRDDAYAAVRSIVKANPDLAADLVMGGEDEAGALLFRAAGPELVELAREREYV